ncbi:creatininase family protein, partial [Acinetobacter baumannii]
MHLHPELVRTDRLRRDGLFSDPPIAGMIHGFEERSEEGSIGASDCATASKGKAMLDACIEKVAANIEVLADGYVLR